MESKNVQYLCKGSFGSLPIKVEDKVGRKMAMLFEGRCLGIQPSIAAKKYGYSTKRYYQVLNSFFEDGTDGLFNKKPGPRKKYVRTDEVVNQIIRYRFLDPDASAAVIAQKLKQSGFTVSQRSVERTITDYGLQKNSIC